jgi:hypothetical protein
LDNRRFLRGIALASPLLVREAYRLREKADTGRPKERRRLEMSLLRYLSRAALKLSPYSTLTRVALASVVTDLGQGDVRLVGSEWRERSLLRIKRYLLDQYQEMLFRHAPFRERLLVEFNSSIVEFSPGRFLFLRPGRWELVAARATARDLQCTG